MGMGSSFIPGASGGGLGAAGPGAMTGFSDPSAYMGGTGGGSFMPGGGSSGIDTTGPGAMDSYSGGLGGGSGDGVSSVSGAY